MRVENNNNNKQSIVGSVLQWIVRTLGYNWIWFAVSILLCVVVGHIYYARFATPVYHVKAGVMLRDMAAEVDRFHSRDLMEKVVRDNGYHTNYAVKGTTPVKLLVDSFALTRLNSELKLDVKQTKQAITVVGSYGQKTFSAEAPKLPIVLSTPVGDLLLSDGDAGNKLKPGGLVSIVVTPPLLVAKKYANAVKVDMQVGGNTTLVYLSLTETNELRGKNFLSGLIKHYNAEIADEKSRLVQKEVALIDQSLENVHEELALLKQNIKSHRQNNTASGKFTLPKSEYPRLKFLENDDEQATGHVPDEGGEGDDIEESIERDIIFQIYGKGIDVNLVMLLLEYNSGLTRRDYLLREKQTMEWKTALDTESAKVLESPSAGNPEVPQRNCIYAWSLLIGLLLPFLIFGVAQLFNFSEGDKGYRPSAGSPSNYFWRK
ncbi:hypothetical protein AGMMS49965_03850 [Bacteroidia bacterium]|nr:hypothetical protein AGMMS49965_03850 [Bacteroidia bacterium]